MSDRATRSGFWPPFLHFLRGGAIGGVAVVCAVAVRQYFLGVAAAGNENVLVGIFAVFLLAAVTMDRAIRCPGEHLPLVFLLAESLAMTVAAGLAAFVALLIVPLHPEGMGLPAALAPMLLAFLLLTLFPWSIQAAVRRLAWRRGWTSEPDAGSTTWRDEFTGFAAGVAGRNLVNLGCVLGGLLAVLGIVEVISPNGWCGSQPVGQMPLFLIIVILANAGASDRPTVRRVVSMAFVGFAGGGAAIFAAQTSTGCTDVVDWLGWGRDRVELAIGGIVAFAVYLTHEHIMGERPDFGEDKAFEESTDES